MNLKNEYLKRIEIIKSKVDTRSKEMELRQMDDKENEYKLEEKIKNYENNIKELSINLEINSYELFELNQKQFCIPKIKKFNPQNTNFLKKISDCENKFKSSINEIIENEKNYKRETILQELKIKNEFKIRNQNLINVDNNLNDKLNNLQQQIDKKYLDLKEVNKEYEFNLGDKFINRRKNLNILENEYDKISKNRIKNRDIQKKIDKSEIENNLLKKQMLKKEEIELTKLNQFIKSQKIYIKNELNSENKKVYFKNIKNKNKDYLDKINKNKIKIVESNKKINILKKELLDNQNLNIRYPNQPKKERFNKSIKNIKLTIEKIKYDKFSVSLEKKINLELIEKNRFFYINEIKDLCQIFITYQYNSEKNESELENNFINEINLLKINNKKQKKDNKNNLKLFLQDNLIELYNLKKKNNKKKELEKNISLEKKELEDMNKKLKNTIYIFKKTKLKNELSIKSLEEENNNLTIDDLIEIEELNQKILSISY